MRGAPQESEPRALLLARLARLPKEVLVRLEVLAEPPGVRLVACGLSVACLWSRRAAGQGRR
jgi:hypothetical protein